jgi:hypothetical protein
MLDPAIHVADKSAWTIGSSPVVTKNGRIAAVKSNAMAHPGRRGLDPIASRSAADGRSRQSIPFGTLQR